MSPGHGSCWLTHRGNHSPLSQQAPVGVTWSSITRVGSIERWDPGLGSESCRQRTGSEEPEESGGSAPEQTPRTPRTAVLLPRKLSLTLRPARTRLALTPRNTPGAGDRSLVTPSFLDPTAGPCLARGLLLTRKCRELRRRSETGKGHLPTHDEQHQPATPATGPTACLPQPWLARPQA